MEIIMKPAIPARALTATALLFAAAMFGFFFSWSLTMIGLDEAEPLVAVRGMQAVNESIRTAVFMATFAGTPVLLAAVAAYHAVRQQRQRAIAFAVATVIYVATVIAVTAIYNVPMNETLAVVDVTEMNAASVWEEYSGPWQDWNLVRTIGSGLAVIAGLVGILLPGAKRVS